EWPEIQGRPFAVKSKSAKDALLRELAKDALREFGERETARFLAEGGHVHFCPPEKTTRMMDKGGVRHLLSHVTRTGGMILVPAVASTKKTAGKRMGRPRLYDERPMTAAERKAHSRAMQAVKAPAPNRRPRPDADRRPHPPPAASGSFSSEGTVRSLSSRVTRSGNMILVTAFPTPRRSKEPLIGEIMISCKPRSETPPRKLRWSTPTVTEVPFDSLSTELRLMALGLAA